MATPSQKVIIPKGLVNPHETTIIEIPVKLQNKPAVIARPKSNYAVNRSKLSNNNNCDLINCYRKATDNLRLLNGQREELINFQTKQLAKERGDGSRHSIKKMSSHKKCNRSNDDANETIPSRKLSLSVIESNDDHVSTVYVNNRDRKCYAKSSPKKNGDEDKRDIDRALDDMENNELMRIQKDLKEFQEARRKLILRATNLNPCH